MMLASEILGAGESSPPSSNWLKMVALCLVITLLSELLQLVKREIKKIKGEQKNGKKTGQKSGE